MDDFGRNFLSDPGIVIKQEPNPNDSSTMNISASVPIPPKRDNNEYRDLDFDYSLSPLYRDVRLPGQLSTPSMFDNNSWSLNRLINADEFLKSEAFIHMDEDDIFQVDKADLIQGPTLAELNANDENFLGDLNFDDLLLPEESTYTTLDKNTTMHAKSNNLNNNLSSCPPEGSLYLKDLELPSSVPIGSFDCFKYKTPMEAFSPGSQDSSSSSLLQSSSPMNIVNVHPKHRTTLQDLLEKAGSNESGLGQSYPERNNPMFGPNAKLMKGQQSGLSSSAPTHLGLEQIWQRREPRKHLLSTSSLAEAGSTSSLSTGGLLSPDIPDFSLDEDSDDENEGHYEDFSSENESDEDDDPNRSGSSKKERYFWQYNVQAKGPKGQRLVMKCKMEDPHTLHEVTDPVFSPDCSVRGIKHSGKARKGDGNDLTPNAKKLHSIGKELDKLSRIINDMTPVSELPFTVRPTSRKEKNKLASRACRLKKKAQHEANKIKLGGLEIEHRRLINGIAQSRHILAAKLREQPNEKQEELTASFERIVKNCSKVRVAGHTAEYVNKILDRLKNGVNTTHSEDL